MKHVGDITKLNGAELEPVWCVTGGSPCQGLSVAGKRAGLADERSGLFMEQVRVVKEMREHDKHTGRTDELVRPRYMVWENVPGALSSNSGNDFAAVLEEIIKIAEPEAPCVQVPEYGWPSYGGYRSMDGRWSVAYRIHDAQWWGVPQRRRRISVVADFGGSTAHEILFESNSLYGNSEEGCAAGARPAGATEAGASQAGGITGNGQTLFCMATQQGGAEIRTDDKAPTLTASAGMSGNNQPIVYCLQGNGIGRSDTAGCAGRGWREDVSYTLNTVDRPAVCVALNGVRRFTPLECTRLQGYPDGWVDIGEWADEKGRVHKDSDAPKYKALGNSIALPFWRWMFSRMAQYLPAGAALGSLFDGIGGFPLCWEELHGKGSARWASEVEPFCIAVTMRHFKEESNE